MDCCHLSRIYVLEKRKHFRASTRGACRHGSRSQSTVTGRRCHPGQPAWRGQGRGGRGRAQPDTYNMEWEKSSVVALQEIALQEIVWLLRVLFLHPCHTRRTPISAISAIMHTICNHAHICVGVNPVLKNKKKNRKTEFHSTVAERYKRLIADNTKDANA